ncbi:hypothetical protein D3C87_583550 [compost metagenome]
MSKPVDAPSAVARYISKVQSANNRGSKDVVLSIQEAIDLSAALTLMLSKQSSLLEDIVELQKRAAAGPTEIILDGGSLAKN